MSRVGSCRLSQARITDFAQLKVGLSVPKILDLRDFWRQKIEIGD